MNRFDRALAILLLLRGGKTLSATSLASHFEVSARTIYRDIETLSAVGVPIYAEMGRDGGFRLVEGYFLPPVMFSVGEATSLLLGLSLFRGLRARPFAAELETATQKLLAAVPENVRAVLTEAQRVIGFEAVPGDAFHAERATLPPDTPATTEPANAREARVVEGFLRALLDRRSVLLAYRSPYRASAEEFTAIPYGLLWDRDRWYLVGRRVGQQAESRLWRADRVLRLEARAPAADVDSAFDVRALLGRAWLQTAMAAWIEEAPVKIRLSRRQAARLQEDWYYRSARFEPLSPDEMLMTFGEESRDVVLELVRWLGPGAELLEPEAWRAAVRAELVEMLARYADAV